MDRSFFIIRLILEPSRIQTKNQSPAYLVLVVVVVDLHIQRIVLATEETTVPNKSAIDYQMPIPLVVTKRY